VHEELPLCSPSFLRQLNRTPYATATFFLSVVPSTFGFLTSRVLGGENSYVTLNQVGKSVRRFVLWRVFLR
jgi:hypothetical protein